MVWRGGRRVTGDRCVTKIQSITGRPSRRLALLASDLALTGRRILVAFLQPCPSPSLPIALIYPVGRQIAPPASPRLPPTTLVSAHLPTARLLCLPRRGIWHKRLPAFGALTSRTVLHSSWSATVPSSSSRFRLSCPVSRPPAPHRSSPDFQATAVTRIFEPPALKDHPGADPCQSFPERTTSGIPVMRNRANGRQRLMFRTAGL